MSPVAAFYIVTWAAIVVLFFGLAAVLREVRLLRGIVTRDPDGFTTAPVDLALGPRFAGGDRGRVVLAADTGCPLCLAVARSLAAQGVQATLLTHEPAAAWADVADRLEVASDTESWRAVSHLSPPVLMLVDPTGQVRKLILPVRVEEADRVVAEWTELILEGIGDVAGARPNP